MPDPQTNNPEPPAEDAEKGFWDKLTQVVRTEVSAEFETRIKNAKPTGTARTGRKTIPDFIADIMFPQG